MELHKLLMWESLSPWREWCANAFCRCPGNKTRKNYGPQDQKSWDATPCFAKTAETSTSLYEELTQQRRPTQREVRKKQSTWHADDRFSGSIQRQGQRCAMREAETIAIQRSATFFRHQNKVFCILCAIETRLTCSWKKLKTILGCESLVYSGDEILMALHRKAGSLVVEKMLQWDYGAAQIWVMGQLFCSDVFQFCNETLLSINTTDITLL